MKIFSKITIALLAGAMAGFAGSVTSCSNNDFDTNQYASEGVHLNVFGPSPVARGGILRFLGTGMDQITAVSIPGCSDITDINVISNEEIRVTVPQSATPGKVTLKYASGEITTKTMLTYTEPISIESISPQTVKAGDQLTIKGEYLNLIAEVIFADNIAVTEEDFIAHSREEIKLTVPEEAQTGKIIISDGNPTLPNWIYSETDLIVVLPSVEAPLDLTNAKPGDVITVAGKDLDLVRSVLMPDGSEVKFEYADGSITFTLPDNISDGAIVAVPASGVKVAIANVGVVVPTELEISPAEGIRPGNLITIKGVNMQEVKNITLVNVADAVKPVSVSLTEVKFVWPAMAQSGYIVLNLRSGKTVALEAYTAKPEVMGFNPNPVSAASEFTINGKNLDLVSSVTFSNGTVIETSTSTPDQLSLTAPADASTGTLVLTMANGETVVTPELGINAPVCAYIIDTMTEEPHGGDLLVVKVANGEHLTGVTVKGQSVQYILTGETLYISLPQASGKGTVVTLISDNGEISYTYDCIPATHVENVVWSGAWQNDSWSGNQDLAWGGYDWSQVPVGAHLEIYTTPTVDPGAWWCISLRTGQSWGALAGVPSQYDTPESPLIVDLTAETLDDLIKNNGLVITGQGYILTKIVISWEISLETTIWQGSQTISGWNGNQDLAWGGFDWSSVKPGQILRFYMTPTVADGSWWCVALRHGNGWAEIPGVPGQIDMPSSPIEITLTSEIISDLVANGGLVFSGDGYVMTKITLE